MSDEHNYCIFGPADQLRTGISSVKGSIYQLYPDDFILSEHSRKDWAARRETKRARWSHRVLCGMWRDSSLPSRTSCGMAGAVPRSAAGPRTWVPPRKCRICILVVTLYSRPKWKTTSNVDATFTYVQTIDIDTGYKMPVRGIVL